MSEPAIPLGSVRLLLWRRTVYIPLSQLDCHTHVLGKTGAGKSYFLASLFLSLFRAGRGVTLIDPHGDLASLILSHLVAGGDLDTTVARQRMVYLNLRRAEATGRFLPFNILRQPYPDHAMAELIAESFRRAWPELAHGAPTFENILKHSVIALRQAGEPLSSLSRLLTNRDFREDVLAQTSDEQVLRFFHDRLDAWGRDGPTMKESTLNRVDLLTLSPLLATGWPLPTTRWIFGPCWTPARLSLSTWRSLPGHPPALRLPAYRGDGISSAVPGRPAGNRPANQPPPDDR